MAAYEILNYVNGDGGTVRVQPIAECWSETMCCQLVVNGLTGLLTNIPMIYVLGNPMH